MSSSGNFEGSIVVDGAIRSHGVGIWMDDRNFVLKEVTQFSSFCRFNIYLQPFSQSMILTQDPDRMKEGLFFDIRGHKVGLVSHGPLGHPGDGEFNNRKVIVFLTTVTYLADRIDVAIEGQTTSGIDAYDANKILPAGRFSVKFAIPKERIAEFFCLNDRAHANVLSAFAQAFP